MAATKSHSLPWQQELQTELLLELQEPLPLLELLLLLELQEPLELQELP